MCVCVFSVQIFLVHCVEAPADSVSSNLSDLEEDYYLLLYALFPPPSNYNSTMTRVCVCEGESERWIVRQRGEKKT